MRNMFNEKDQELILSIPLCRSGGLDCMFLEIQREGAVF